MGQTLTEEQARSMLPGLLEDYLEELRVRGQDLDG